MTTTSSASPSSSTSNPAYRLAQNAVTYTSLDDVALDRSVVTSMATSMSHQSSTTGRSPTRSRAAAAGCSPGVNLLRVGAAKTMGVKDFEFSQNHLLFWDKLEKANYWLEAIIETADRDVDDRTVAHLLANPAEDGGQWNMFVALVAQARPGPQGRDARDPLVVQDRRTEPLDRPAPAADRARPACQQPRPAPSADQLRDYQARTRSRSLHRILAIHLGTPPSTVQWQWTDKDKGFHRDDDDDAAGVRREVRRARRSTTTSASSTTRDRPARSAAPTPSSTSATSSTLRRSSTSTSRCR